MHSLCDYSFIFFINNYYKKNKLCFIYNMNSLVFAFVCGLRIYTYFAIYCCSEDIEYMIIESAAVFTIYRGNEFKKINGEGSQLYDKVI